MKFGRILANAMARRIAYVVVAMALAWLGLTDAKAAAPCNGFAANCTIMEAKADCEAAAAVAQFNGRCIINEAQRYWQCRRTSSAGNDVVCTPRYLFYWNLTGCPAGQDFNAHTGSCQPVCTGRPSTVQPFLPLSGSTQCFNGCVVSYMQNGDDETSTRSYSGAMCGNDQFKQNCPAGTFWNSYMGVCQPIQPDCPQGQVREGGQCKPENKCPDGMILVTGSTPGAIAQGALHCKPSENECPAGTIKAPSGQCLPGEGQCAAGEARRKDGTCGRDSNGDGTADDDDEDPDNDSDKDFFTGGDSCTTPPSCNGSPIMCGQARIQWRIDCNTRKNVNISGGSCTQVPLCTGDKCNAMEYASLLQQWRTTCAVEKMAKGTSDGDGQPEWTKVTGNGTEGAGEEPEGPTRRISLGLGMLDSSGFLGGGSCPTFGSVDLGTFGTVDLDQYDWICQFLAAVRIVLIGVGGFIAFGILAGRGIA
jgi:hypothetical protein